jgi:hypothetical protein
MITPVHAMYLPPQYRSHTATVQGAAVIDTVYPPTTADATPPAAPNNTMTGRTKVPANQDVALLFRTNAHTWIDIKALTVQHDGGATALPRKCH